MIRPCPLSELANVLGLPVPAADPLVSAVSTDSRQIDDAALFVALRGEHHDGHNFIGAVSACGAVAAVVEQPAAAVIPQLVVRDSLQAYGRLAAFNRSLWHGSLLALTGSAGKTGTKEMIAAICARAGSTLSTEGNFNNEIGVPKTLFRLTPEMRYAVIEMGAAKQGDIAYLCGIARPDIAVLTNAMAAHLAGFGTLETVAKTKGEIYSALSPDGIAVLNLDDRFAAMWREMIGARQTVTVSAGGLKEADIRAEAVQSDAAGCHFVLEIGVHRRDVQLTLLGAHQAANAVAAAGACHAAGIGIDTIVEGLQSVRPVSGRMVTHTNARGALIIDDTYNANPGAVRAAIDALLGLRGETVLVLGTMAELGPDAERLHRDVGRYARDKGVKTFYALGEHARDYASGFGTGAQVFADLSVLLEALEASNRAGCVILVKGSRSARMERVVTALLDASPDRAAEVC